MSSIIIAEKPAGTPVMMTSLYLESPLVETKTMSCASACTGTSRLLLCHGHLSRGVELIRTGAAKDMYYPTHVQQRVSDAARTGVEVGNSRDNGVSKLKMKESTALL